MFRRVLFEGRSISLYKNRPIWADAAGGDFALSQKGPSKTFQFFGNNLVQCLNKNSEWTFRNYQCQFRHGVQSLNLAIQLARKMTNSQNDKYEKRQMQNNK